MTRTYEQFMISQVNQWMIQLIEDPDLEIPPSVLRFYFAYMTKQLMEPLDR